MGDSRSKSAYLTRLELEQFLSANVGHCYLMTATFAESITDKREAARRWKPLRDYLSRQGVEGVGVWQRQRARGQREGNEGAWHVHVVVNQRLDIGKLRAFVTAHGWGPFINLRFIHGHARDWFAQPEKVVKYLTRYLTRDLCESEGRSQMQVRVECPRSGTVKFRWRSGAAAVWRAGCAALGYVPAYNDAKGRADAWRLGCVHYGISYSNLMGAFVVGASVSWLRHFTG